MIKFDLVAIQNQWLRKFECFFLTQREIHFISVLSIILYRLVLFSADSEFVFFLYNSNDYSIAPIACKYFFLSNYISFALWFKSLWKHFMCCHFFSTRVFGYKCYWYAWRWRLTISYALGMNRWTRREKSTDRTTDWQLLFTHDAVENKNDPVLQESNENKLQQQQQQQQKRKMQCVSPPELSIPICAWNVIIMN